MSRPLDLADVAFDNLADSLENENLSDLEVIQFFERITELSEQEIAEVEDDLEDDDLDADEDDD